MQEDQDLSLCTQGPHKKSTTSRPSNASNGIHHQHIKEFTHEAHHPSNNQIKISKQVQSYQEAQIPVTKDQPGSRNLTMDSNGTKIQLRGT